MKKLVHNKMEKLAHYHQNATLSKSAFLGMLTACIEVYKQEALGIILGETHRKHYKVLDVVPYQSARRGYAAVTVPAQRLRRINYVVEHVTKSHVLGFFHSHPDFPDYLSGLDREEHMKEKLPLQVLVLVKRTKKRRKWSFHEDLSLSGTVGSRYFIKMRAYVYEKKTKSIHPTKIVCPFLRSVTLLESL